MAITDPLILPPDLEIVPVTDLADDMRARLECSDGDFAVSRPHSRAPSKIVDSTAGELLRRFTTARRIIDVVVEFGAANNTEPEQLLLDAFPMLQRFVDAGLLVEADSRKARRIAASREPGDAIGDWEVIRCVQVLEDVELYQARSQSVHAAALKVARYENAHVREMLARERRILELLGGVLSPRLLTAGDHEGCPFFVMEWRAGVSAHAAAEECRSAPSREGVRRLVTLCRDIVDAYAALHARGILHGDVHERNLLVDSAGSVTLLDFGLSREIVLASGARAPHRGGVGAYFEPEYAAARADKRSVPQVTEAAEQYSVAALLYTLFTGGTYLNFALDRHEAMRQIATERPLAFAARSLPPFPALEGVLARALEKEPGRRFPSMSDFAAALREIECGLESRAEDDSPLSRSVNSRVLLTSALEQLRRGGTLFDAGVRDAPTANVNFGSAGIAAALYRMALSRDDASLLSLADVWASRAAAELSSRRACYNKALGLTRATVGPTSLYHTASGVHAVRALIARAMGDFVSMNRAMQEFVASARRGGTNLDLTLGRSGILLGCALLLEAAPRNVLVDTAPVLKLGNRIASSVWGQMQALPRVGAPSSMASLGIAHGWGGILYATLRWRLATGSGLEPSLRLRLDELAACAEPDGRGLRWRWIDNGSTSPRSHGYMAGWCNGSAGFVYLWLLANAAYRAPEYLALARGAAWNAWEDETDHSLDLCCGISGRAYALLACFRETGEREWLRRAESLAERASEFVEDADGAWPLAATSLYKSVLGTALLVSDLDRPESARMPMFEHEGWPLQR